MLAGDDCNIVATELAGSEINCHTNVKIRVDRGELQYPSAVLPAIVEAGSL
jgi:hypothetical protein